MLLTPSPNQGIWAFDSLKFATYRAPNFDFASRQFQLVRVKLRFSMRMQPDVVRQLRAPVCMGWFFLTRGLVAV